MIEYNVGMEQRNKWKSTEIYKKAYIVDKKNKWTKKDEYKEMI